jgi:nucleobase:cation symporter-1, NCS1 family
VLADYLVVKRQRLDVEALFDPHGPYRYLNGINVAAVLAVAVGIGLYYAVPDSWVKVVVGVVAGAAAYLALSVVQTRGMSRTPYATGTVASSQRSSSPS